MKPTPHQACAGTSAVTLLAIIAFCVIALYGTGHAAPRDIEAAAVAGAALQRGSLQ
jgi:hypothetical protein